MGTTYISEQMPVSENIYKLDFHVRASIKILFYVKT